MAPDRAPVGRLPGWPELLAAFVEARRHVPFAWGSNDCATLAADAVLALTGQDPLATLRGQWADEAQAREVLTSLGGLPRAVTTALGPPLDHAALAARGAPVCARMDGVPIIGLLLGDCWCAPGEHGLVFRPLGDIRLAWWV